MFVKVNQEKLLYRMNQTFLQKPKNLFAMPELYLNVHQGGVVFPAYSLKLYNTENYKVVSKFD